MRSGSREWGRLAARRDAESSGRTYKSWRRRRCIIALARDIAVTKWRAASGKEGGLLGESEGAKKAVDLLNKFGASATSSAADRQEELLKAHCAGQVVNGGSPFGWRRRIFLHSKPESSGEEGAPISNQSWVLTKVLNENENWRYV